MESLGGLPLHPLLVHAVVVILPLAAAGSLAVAVRPAWNHRYAGLAAVASVAGAVVATVARQAGDLLSHALDLAPQVEEMVNTHGRYGLYVVVASWPFAALSVATAIFGRRPGASAGLTRTVAALATVAGAVVVVLPVLAGHSGSLSVWEGRL